ncbi:TRAP transporter substrate-binding protein DctP [Acuticoccus kandeliae]|uniref:TRAP transporter substrate-binding protein DctP n=1 Tax=Acuticoccus kandeliae TaxID=2073160 RepID=UPI000D3E3921|nr:TRAP transporter substrate-binding protein DctP [Acuticoccus kandeliae]
MKNALAAALVGLTAVMGVSTGATAQTVLKYAQGLSMTDNHQAVGVTAFQEALERLTDGRYTLQIFPSSSLGGERAMAEGLQLGTIDLAQLTIGPLGNWVPEVDMLTMPFLFRDLDHARAVLAGPIGDELLAKFTPETFIGLAWTEDGGMRHLFNKLRPVRTPEDMAGLKIRVQENKVQTLAFEALGALPTPMAFPNMFSGIQQGVIDGGELSLTTIRSNKFPQVAQYLSLTGHFYSGAMFLMAPSTWAGLSDEDKENFREAARIGAQASYKYIDDTFQSNIDQFREGGMDVIEDVDIEAFEAKVAPVYENNYNEMFGADLIERIRSTE